MITKRLMEKLLSIGLLLFALLIMYAVGSFVWEKMDNQASSNELAIGVPYELNKTNIKTGQYENYTAHVTITKNRVTILDGNSKITINPNNLKIHAIHYYCGQVVEIVSGKLDKVIVENGILMIQFGDYEWTGRELKTSKNK